MADKLSEALFERGMIQAEAATRYAADYAAIFGAPYVVRPKAPKAIRPRPRCAWCGNVYGSRWTETTTRKVTAAEGKPTPYRGNALLVCEELRPHGMEDDQPAAMLTRETWDGETYATPYAPFCTLKCGLAFAQEAHRKGFRP